MKFQGHVTTASNQKMWVTASVGGDGVPCLLLFGDLSTMPEHLEREGQRF